MSNKFLQACAYAIRLVKFIRNIPAELQLILESRLCRFITNSDKNGECRKLGFLVCYQNTFAKQETFNNFVMPLQKIHPLSMVRFISLVTHNDLATYSEKVFDIVKKINFIQTPAMVARIWEYVRRFELGTRLSDVYEPEKADLIPVAAELDYPHCLGMKTIIFHGAGNTPEFLLGEIIIDKMQLFVPIRFYRQCSTDMILAMFELPNGGQKMPLYNGDKIEANPHCTVILSDEMAIALCNDSNSNQVFSTWYGGMELIEKIDWELLRGHKVQWLIFDETNNATPTDKYRKAARVAELFDSYGITIEFKFFDNVTWNSSPDTSCRQWGDYSTPERVLSLNDFIFEAGEHGVQVNVKSTKLRCYSDHDLRALPDCPYIINPILKPGHYCLIYGGTGVAKTWFTLAMALGISRGESFIDCWTYSGKARKVLYVAGEMEPEMFGERIQKLSKVESQNFVLVRENLNLTDSVDQKRLLDTIAEYGSQVVILDNLTTLAERGAYENGFGKLLSLINRLKETGIAVVLVHHENKAGEFKGTTKIKDVAEMSLHLVKAPGNSGIKLYVKADKIRGKAEKSAVAFKVHFSPEYPSSKWRTLDLSDAERRIFGEDDPFCSDAEIAARKTKHEMLAWQFMDDDAKAITIITDTLAGNSLAVTAANRAIPVLAVEEFANEFELTTENIRKHLNTVQKKAREQNGDKGNSPKVLAALVWEQMKIEPEYNNSYSNTL